MSGLALRTRAGEPSEDAARRGLLAWVASVDHKQIGIMYMLSSLLFFGIGGIEALLIRIQLSVPDNHFLGPDTFNQVFTMHGTTMIFLVVMPMLTGIVDLRDSADDRRARHGVPAAERDELLAPAIRRRSAVFQFLRRRCAERRMVQLHAAERASVLDLQRT